MAITEARRPTTRPLASMMTHFFSISAVLSVKVDMVSPEVALSIRRLKKDKAAIRAAELACFYTRRLRASTRHLRKLSRFIHAKQCFTFVVIIYHNFSRNNGRF